MSLIDRNTVVVGVGADISKANFSQVLKDANSPAYGEAPACYDAVVNEGVSPAFALAIFKKESQYATDPKSEVFKFKNNNPGNCRSSTIGPMPLISTDRGIFVNYPDFASGFRDLAHRLIAPDYVYSQEKRVTVGQIINRFAPASDSNDPAGYTVTVVTLMNQWIAREVTPTMTPQEYFIQWQGTNGNNFWAGRDGEQTVSIVDHIMQGTMESSDGWFKNPKSEVSAHFGVAKDGRVWQWVDTANRAWANGIPENPDTFIPWIADAMARKKNPNDFTISIEHEGNTGETMPEAQYQATLWLHRHIMSLYPAIKPDRQHIIGHYQISHLSRPNCPGTGFPWARLLNDLNSDKSGGFNKVPDNINPAPAPATQPPGNVLYINATQKSLGGGFRLFWEGLNKLGDNYNLMILGWPVTNEFDMSFSTAPDKKRTVQLFERSALIYEPENVSPWDNHTATVDQIIEIKAYAVANKLL